MSELDQVRQEYPEYKDWSDEDLGWALKDKYHPNMPDDEYWKELGVNPTNNQEPHAGMQDQEQRVTGWRGVGKDVLQGAADLRHIPAGIGHLLSEAPSEIEGASQQEPSRAGKNILAGLGEFGHSLLSIPSNIYEYGNKKELLPEPLKSFGAPWKPQEFDYARGVGLGEEKPGDKLLRALPEIIATLGGAEAGQLRNLGRTAARTATYSTQAVAHNQNPITATLTGPALSGATRLALRGISGLAGLTREGLTNPFSQAGVAKKIAAQTEGLLTPEELSRNVRAVKGTHTDIGNVVGSPVLAQKLSNEIMPQAKDAVVDKIMRQREQEVQQRAKQVGNIASKGKLTDVDLNPLVEKLTQASEKESKFIKNELYRPVDKLAEAENIILELPTFKAMAAEDALAIEKSPMLEANKKFKNRYNKLLGLQKTENVVSGKIVDKSGKPLSETIQTSSISEAKAVFNELYSEGLRMAKSESAIDRATGDLYKRLANAGNSDIESLLSRKGSKNIQNTYEKAQEHYRSDFSRFLDKDVRKFLDGTKDYDSIVHDIIKPNKIKDHYSQIEKIVDILPQNEKHILGAAYLQKAFNEYGVLQPTELANLWNKLGKRQQIALFPDSAMREAIRDFVNLKNMNADALNKWFNPKTGAKNQGMIAKVMEVLKGSGPGGAIGGTIGTAMGGPVGGILGGVFGGYAGKTLSKAHNTRIAKMYTSPEFRELLLKEMQKNSKNNKKYIPLSDNGFTEILKKAAKRFGAVGNAAKNKEEK